MFYTLLSHYRLGDIITNEQGVIVYPRQYFGKSFPEWEYDEYDDEYYEIPTTFIDCSKSLKRLKNEYEKTRYGYAGKRLTDYGRLLRECRRRKHSDRRESAIKALRKRREKITTTSVYAEMKRQDAERPRRRRGGTGS